MVKQKGALPPTKLTPYMANVYRALFLVGTVGIIVGCCGIAVLLGMVSVVCVGVPYTSIDPTGRLTSLDCVDFADVENKKYWYSHTLFAEYWTYLTEKNAMLTNICVNGGVLAIVTSFLRLQAHSRALALESTEDSKKKK